MLNNILILTGKSVSKISRLLNRGHGSTWPGHIALSINHNFIKQLLKNSQTKVIFIAGTNGKTTTAKLIKHILKKSGKKIFHNEAGANLLNGIASTLIQYGNIVGRLQYDYAIFEIDENTLPLAIKEITPDYIILLNLFRDQLDRYGEVNTIAKRWSLALKNLPDSATIILNADDPQIAYLSLSRNIATAIRSDRALYFGIQDKTLAQKKFQHASDSSYCPKCGTRLEYKTVYFSHLGKWHCQKCKLKRQEKVYSSIPKSSLLGVYNHYNLLAASLLAKTLGIEKETIDEALKTFKQAFGRQEIIEYHDRKVQIFLSKNPTGFNESLRTIQGLGANHILFVLNDRIPDGRDVSWIWDIDTEEFLNNAMEITVSGDRCYDMGLRIKYTDSPEFQISNFKFQIESTLEKAIDIALENVQNQEVLYILSTYSAMLEVRKLLTGKKIL